MKNINKLVEKVKSNDRKAFENLYDLTAAELYWYCRRLCGNDDDAKDLMQETYFNVWKKINSYTDINFKAWLHSIAHNLWINRLKKKKDEFSLDEEFTELAEDEDFSPVNQSEQNIQREEIMQLIDESLSDVQRMTVIMYYYDEWSVSEIAEKMECSEGTVKSRLHSARKKLSDELRVKNLCSVSLPMLFRYDSEQAGLPEALNAVKENIVHKTTISIIQIPCIIGVVSTCAIIIGTAISDIGLPSEHKAVDNSALAAYDSSDNPETEHTQTDITEKSVSDIITSETAPNSEIPENISVQTVNESIFTENNIKEVTDMNKTVNTIISSITAAAVITSGTMLTTSAETIDESLPNIETTSVSTEDNYYWWIENDIYCAALKTCPYDENNKNLMPVHTVWEQDTNEYPRIAIDTSSEEFKNFIKNAEISYRCRNGVESNGRWGLVGLSPAGFDKDGNYVIANTTEDCEIKYDENGDRIFYMHGERELSPQPCGYASKNGILYELRKKAFNEIIVTFNDENEPEIYNYAEDYQLLDAEKRIFTTRDLSDNSIVIAKKTDKYPESTILQKGDATLDSNVDVRDVSKYAQHIVKLDTIPDYADIIADIDSDGIIGINDIMQLKRFLINDISEI